MADFVTQNCNSARETRFLALKLSPKYMCILFRTFGIPFLRKVFSLFLPLKKENRTFNQ